MATPNHRISTVILDSLMVSCCTCRAPKRARNSSHRHILHLSALVSGNTQSPDLDGALGFVGGLTLHLRGRNFSHSQTSTSPPLEAPLCSACLACSAILANNDQATVTNQLWQVCTITNHKSPETSTSATKRGPAAGGRKPLSPATEPSGRRALP